ncbi:hypothetical protein JCM10207_000622 [Rhodosporidiobolus poonsookiae]
MSVAVAVLRVCEKSEEREQYLASVISAIGFPSLDHLEDFIVLHGSVRVVPAHDAGRSLPLDETQTQLSDTTHLQRFQERRAQNADLKRENHRLAEEVRLAREERERDRGRIDELQVDKRRLLDRIEQLKEDVERLKDEGATGAVGSSSTVASPSAEQQLQLLYDDMDDLERQLGEAEEALEHAKGVQDEQALELRTAHEEMRELAAQKSTVEKELEALKKRFTVLKGALLGEDPLEEERVLTSSATLAQGAASPRSAAGPAPTSPAPAAAEMALDVTPKASQGRITAPALAPGGGDTPIPAVPGSSSASPLPTADLSATAPATAAPPSTAAAIPPRPTAIPPHLRPAGASTPSAAHPPPSAPAPPTPAAPSPSDAPHTPSSTSDGLTSTHRNQYKLWPHLLASYLSFRADYLVQLERQRDAAELLSTLEEPTRLAILSKLGPPPESLSASACVEEEPPIDARFPAQGSPALVLPGLGGSAFDRRAAAQSGQVDAVYRRVEGLEQQLEKRVKKMRTWTDRVGRACDKALARQTIGVQGGQAPLPTAQTQGGVKRPLLVEDAAPSSSAASGAEGATPRGAPVRKRRKVVKAATGAGTADEPSASTKPPLSTAPGTSALPAVASLAAAARPQTPQPAATSPSAAAVALPSSKGKKRWNLVSPTKRNSALRNSTSAAASPRTSPRSPGKIRTLNLNLSSPKKSAAAAAAVLVADTPAVTPARAAPSCAAEAAAPPEATPRPQPARQRSSGPLSNPTSTYEPEPDTLVTERSSSVAAVARVRSSSRSPSKPGPRRSSSVAAHAHVQAVVQVRADDAMEDDPFVGGAGPSRAAQGKGKAKEENGAVLPLQPSPNSRRARQRSSSASPSKNATPSRAAARAVALDRSSTSSPSPTKPGRALALLAADEDEDVDEDDDLAANAMPPSAQPDRRWTSKGRLPGAPGPALLFSSPPRFDIPGGMSDEDEDEENDDGSEKAMRGELRFFGGLGSPPMSSPGAKGKGREKGKERAVEREVKKGKKEGKKRKRPAQDEEDDLEPVETLVKREEEDDDRAFKAVDPKLGADFDSSSSSSTSPPRSARNRRRKTDGAGAGGKKGRRSELTDAQLANIEAAERRGEAMGEFPAHGDEEGRKKWDCELKRMRRERIAAEKAGSKTGKRAIEVNPDRNKGQQHLIKESIRNKAERAKMLAEPCADCAAYYARDGRNVPDGICDHQTRKPGRMMGHLEMRAQQNEKRLQDLSRHKVQHRTEPEPPGYWQMGFPDTQQVEVMQRDAKALNAEKRAYREAEAATTSTSTSRAEEERGNVLQGGGPSTSEAVEQARAEECAGEEEDTRRGYEREEQGLRKVRECDDWTDTHRKGKGNMHNRG